MSINLIKPGGGGNDTPLRVPPTRSFEELPCFGVKFSNIHPASESGFLSEIFSFSGGAQNLLLNKFFCYANFSIVLKPFLGGRWNCLREKPAVSRTMYQNTEMSCFQRKP